MTWDQPALAAIRILDPHSWGNGVTECHEDGADAMKIGLVSLTLNSLVEKEESAYSIAWWAGYMWALGEKK